MQVQILSSRGSYLGWFSNKTFFIIRKLFFWVIVPTIKDIKHLFIRIQQVEVSLIKRTANAVVKGRSGKWIGAIFVGKNGEGKRRVAGCYSWTMTSKTVVICLQLERLC